MDLSSECGHHCGTITMGLTHRHTAHCDCPDCHNGNAPRTDSDISQDENPEPDVKESISE